MKLYQVQGGYVLRTNDNRVYSILHLKEHFMFTSETFVINGKLLREIPNHLKRICFRLNKKQCA